MEQEFYIMLAPPVKNVALASVCLEKKPTDSKKNHCRPIWIAEYATILCRRVNANLHLLHKIANPILVCNN